MRGPSGRIQVHTTDLEQTRLPHSCLHWLVSDEGIALRGEGSLEPRRSLAWVRGSGEQSSLGGQGGGGQGEVASLSKGPSALCGYPVLPSGLLKLL